LGLTVSGSKRRNRNELSSKASLQTPLQGELTALLKTLSSFKRGPSGKGRIRKGEGKRKRREKRGEGKGEYWGKMGKKEREGKRKGEKVLVSWLPSQNRADAHGKARYAKCSSSYCDAKLWTLDITYRVVQKKNCTKFNAPSFCNRLQYRAVFTKMLRKDQRLPVNVKFVSVG